MPYELNGHIIKEAVAVFDTPDQLYRAIDDLDDNPDAPRRAYISEEAVGAAERAAIGAPLYVAAFMALGVVVNPALPMSAAIAAVVVGGGIGAILGSALAKRVGDHHADYLANQIRHGGLILWVRTNDAEKEAMALEVLKRNTGHDVHLNDWVPDR